MPGREGREWMRVLGSAGVRQKTPRQALPWPGWNRPAAHQMDAQIAKLTPSPQYMQQPFGGGHSLLHIGGNSGGGGGTVPIVLISVLVEVPSFALDRAGLHRLDAVGADDHVAEALAEFALARTEGLTRAFKRITAAEQIEERERHRTRERSAVQCPPFG